MSIRRLFIGAIGAAILLTAALPVGQAAGFEAPSRDCAASPQRVGETIVGTACDDVIFAPPGVEAVEGGGGDDTIVAAPISASAPCPEGCHLGIGSQTFEGGPGDDVVYGERGNDRLFGGEGNDQLFGGIGDDLLKGGPGNDRLSGGFGADSLDGEAGDDYVRGDATQDTILDTGSGGNDTLSYSTGVTPGFPNNQAYPDFSLVPNLPPAGGERGVYLDLDGDLGDDGVAPFGGGVDAVEGGAFETVIGTPYSDYIVGSETGETIYGGGGGDVILGNGGNDDLHGGADGDDLDGGGGSANTVDGGPGSDHCEGATTETACESTVNNGGVVPRDASKISAGLLAPGAGGYAQLYLSASNAVDKVTVSYAPGPTASVTFQLGSGSAPFDTGAAAASGCEPPSGSTLVCPLDRPLDSLVVAGMGGDDTLQASGFPASVSVIVSGGEGSDTLTGGDQTEDVLVDGPGSGDDTLDALGGDDALLNNEGADRLFGGVGNDLFLSNSTCDGDLIDGGDGSERDNASWAKFKSGVGANLGSGLAGEPTAGGAPKCAGGTLDSLQGIEDLEGTSSGDVFYGGPGNNQLLGWAGADTYSSGAGSDVILANSGDKDTAIECGDDVDTALIDRAPIGDVAAPDCENVQEADPNSFRVETQLPPPTPPAAAPPSESSPPKAGGHKPTSRPPSQACVAGARRRVVRCASHPRNLSFEPLGRVEGIRWRHWGSGRAIGFGRLTITEKCCGGKVTAHARIRASGLESCKSRRWYTHLSVTYGRGYRRPFLRSALIQTPCG
jgi:Ca2+-binding RTX toxin-like protein